MTSKILYKIYPADPSTMTHLPKQEGKDNGHFFPFGCLSILSLWTGVVLLIVNFIGGGFGWFVCLALTILFWKISDNLKNASNMKADLEFRKQKAIEEAEFYSKQLNEILTKSKEIVNEILPHFESSAKASIEIAKVDFSENAISPFWDKIEEASKLLAYYKEAIEQLAFNGELYSKVLEGKKHNFPTPFPIGTNISISQNLLDDFNQTIRKAQTKFEFANIWEHRKTQTILIAGFQTLAQAINNMKIEILNSISELNISIKSEFRELKNVQYEQIKSFEAGQATLNDNLSSMDKKLYYIQYNQKPTTQFTRPLLGD